MSTTTGERTQTISQRWDAQSYDKGYAFVWKYGEAVVELLAPQPGERILDLGCGTGHLTQRIAEAGALVSGIDHDPRMVEQARQSYPQLQFEVGDARSFEVAEPLDAVFSNAVLHWVREQEQAVAAVARALRPGGRFVAEFGGRGNTRTMLARLSQALVEHGYPAPAPTGPWYFPGIVEYGLLLDHHGLSLSYATLFDRPTRLEGDEQGMAGWFKMFGQTLLSAVPEDQRGAVMQTAERYLRPTLYRDGAWHADYRRLRVVAVKE